MWSCQKMSEALHYLVDNLFIRFDSNLYRQILGMLMGTNCAPLVADLCLFCYETDIMLSRFENNQADVIEAFYSTSRYPMVYVYNLLKLNTYRRIQIFFFFVFFLSFFILVINVFHRGPYEPSSRREGVRTPCPPPSGSVPARHMEENQR